MPSFPALYLSDDVTPATPIVITLGAGASSAIFVRHLWNDKGGLQGTATPLKGAMLKATAYDGEKWVDHGVPILDDLMLRATITGVIKTGDPTMPDYFSGTVPIGTNNFLAIPDIPKNCAVKIQLQWKAPGGVADNAQQIRLVIVPDRPSMPLAAKATLATGAGIVPGYRVPGLRRHVRGGNIIADGTATVTVERGAVDYDGDRKTFLRSTQLLNQQDVNGNALAAGESYIAALSRTSAGAPVWTKGVKAVAPTIPSVPAGHVAADYVTVLYQAGTSIINQANVTARTLRGDFVAEAGVGLSVVIHPGYGVTDVDEYQFLEQKTTLAGLPANTLSYVWRLSSGTFAVTTTSAAPEVGADLLWEVQTDGASVTSLTDRRQYVTRPGCELTLRFADVLSAVPIPTRTVDLGVLPMDADLLDVDLDLSALDGSWTSGSVKIDVRYFLPGAAVPYPAGGIGVGGASIYTNSGSDDRRPSVAYNATTLRGKFIDHEVRRFSKGTRFTLDIVGVPAAPAAESPQAVVATLNFERYR